MQQPSGSRGVASELRDVLVEATRGRRREGALLVTLPAPVTRGERLLTLPDEHAVYWSSPSGDVVSGIGEAVRLVGGGDDRFGAIDASAEALWGTSEYWAHPRAAPLRPPLVGGFAFQARGTSSDPWRGWTDARFVVPRWTYRSDGAAATLTFAVAAGEEGGAVLAASASLESVLQALGRDLPRQPELRGTRVPRQDRREWMELVADIHRCIRNGELRKVVLSRRLELAFSEVDAIGLIRRLALVEGSYRFALRSAGRTFLGASPELLVRRQGAAVASEALAGTVALRRDGTDEDVDRLGTVLLADPKQRLEHALVADAIHERLSTVCRSIESPGTPAVRRLPDMLHIATSFRAQLAAPLGVAALAGLLHPTPAVGGDPASAALAWLAEHEPDPRGWFAGPVGVLEPEGDGELAVALRCALLDGRRLHVYAGAGIVAASDAAAELEETEVKARSCLAALGIAL